MSFELPVRQKVFSQTISASHLGRFELQILTTWIFTRLIFAFVTQEVFNQTPCYLFRAYSARSNGRSENEEIVSAAADNGLDSRSIFLLDNDAAENMIRCHLNWKNREDDNLISWTCSLLFAFQHAIRRGETDYGPFTLDDICLCVLDTSLLPRGTFIPAGTLMVAFGIETVTKYNYTPEDLCDEYLPQGSVNIQSKSATTSLDSLINSGLYDVIPELDVNEKKRYLWRRVQELRTQLFAEAMPASSEEIDQARRLAITCFGGEFTQPMLIMLLALRKRLMRDPLILNEIMFDFLGRCDLTTLLNKGRKLTNTQIRLLALIDKRHVLALTRF